MVKFLRDICSKCHQEEEEYFIQVKDYIRAHPGASIGEVAGNVGIAVKRVEHFVNSGRLERAGVHITHECQTCGLIISDGIICPKCSTGLQTQVDSLKKSISDEKPKQPQTAADKDKSKDKSKKGKDDEGLHIGKNKK
ncbi:MAG: flagellar protein [Candidatus Riflebacteria bacterium]|nr:flagellar protein [Candidatus Riflebacteria bacterium]